MKHNVGPDPLDRGRFPVDPWRLVETTYNPDDLGLTETLFAVANGYLGMRGNAEEGRPAFAHGTYLNGFHETWPIRHAEAAFGFARTGQTIVNVPDDVKAAAEKMKQAWIDGTYDVYAGPIKAQDGTVKAAEGAALNDGDILGMNWLAEGVDGTLPS